MFDVSFSDYDVDEEQLVRRILAGARLHGGQKCQRALTPRCRGCAIKVARSLPTGKHFLLCFGKFLIRQHTGSVQLCELVQLRRNIRSTAVPAQLRLAPPVVAALG